MKLPALVAIVSLLLVLIFNVAAGPAVTSGPAQPESGIISSGSQLPSGVSPGLNANNTVASQSSAPSQTNSANTSSNSITAPAGNSAATNGSSNGLAGGASANAPSAVDLKKEKVVEVSDNDLAAERARHQEKSEVTKKLESSILNADVSSVDQIIKSREAQPSQPASDEQGRGSQASVAPAKPRD